MQSEEPNADRSRHHHHHHHQTNKKKQNEHEDPHRKNNQEAQKCPRCDSSNTKFCYYNNYSLSQPRFFCKNCRRYWTHGGSLRNVPVGGALRKGKRAKTAPTPTLPPPQPPPPEVSPAVSYMPSFGGIRQETQSFTQALFQSDSFGDMFGGGSVHHGQLYTGNPNTAVVGSTISSSASASAAWPLFSNTVDHHHSTAPETAVWSNIAAASSGGASGSFLSRPSSQWPDHRHLPGSYGSPPP